MLVDEWFYGQPGSKHRPALLRWIAVDDVPEDYWPRLASLLDDAEVARATRFRYRQDYCSYIAAHALGRVLLSGIAGGTPGSWRFTSGPNGKPEVVAPVPMRINWSHTRGLAAAVLTMSDDVGVDVESLKRETIAHDVASRNFAPSECAALAAAVPGRAEEMFLTLWTLKEAYAKAIGLGLSLPLSATCFTLDPPAVAFRGGHAGIEGDWRFRSFRPTPDHVLALALHHPRPGEPDIQAAGMTAEQLCHPWCKGRALHVA